MCPQKIRTPPVYYVHVRCQLRHSETKRFVKVAQRTCCKWLPLLSKLLRAPRHKFIKRNRISSQNVMAVTSISSSGGVDRRQRERIVPTGSNGTGKAGTYWPRAIFVELQSESAGGVRRFAAKTPSPIKRIRQWSASIRRDSRGSLGFSRFHQSHQMICKHDYLRSHCRVTHDTSAVTCCILVETDGTCEQIRQGFLL